MSDSIPPPSNTDQDAAKLVNPVSEQNIESDAKPNTNPDSLIVFHEPAVANSMEPVLDVPVPQPSALERDKEPRFERGDSRAVAADRLISAIATGVFAFLALIVFASWGAYAWWNQQSIAAWIGVTAILTLAAIALLGWFSYVWSQWEYDSRLWRLDSFGLEIRRGVWWRHRITIPRDRVQHTDVEQGPIMRQYGLAKLVIHTAGTSEPSIELPGLSLSTAESLRDQLTRAQLGSKGVVSR